MTYTKKDFLAWKEARNVTDVGLEESAYDLYKDYEKWTETEGLIAAPLGVFSHWMQGSHRKVKKDQRTASGDLRRVWYEGIQLKPATEEPEI